ncbi:flagellar hook-length control protein FliK [uncultured Roseibium sp.]|uniref:flagellar hook-length control protein FliK n=1 Tax=uncultured Roseibium sp. TaxID=1936171 RepID=UPI00321730B7
MTYANSPLLQSSGQTSSKANLSGNQQKGDGGEPSQENQFLNLMRSLTDKTPGAARTGTGQTRSQEKGAAENGSGNGTGVPARSQTKTANVGSGSPATSGRAGTDIPGVLANGTTEADAADTDGPGEDPTRTKASTSVDANVLAGALEQLAGGRAQNAHAAKTGNFGQPGGKAPSQSNAQAGNAKPQNGTATTATGDNGVDDLFAKFGIEPEAVSEGRGTDKQTAGLRSPIDAASVKIVRQETHFAPSYRLSPIQQVGEGIVASLKAEASRTAAEPQGLSIKPEGEAVKTLEIKLTPVELGTVKVTLKITGGNVEVTMTASNPQTAELLKQDRQLLDQMLRATGHKADSITIQAAADDRVTGPQHTGQTQSSGSSFSQADQNAGNGSLQNPLQQGNHQENEDQGRQASDQSASDDHTRSVEDEKESDQRHDGGVYL